MRGRGGRGRGGWKNRPSNQASNDSFTAQSNQNAEMFTPAAQDNSAEWSKPENEAWQGNEQMGDDMGTFDQEMKSDDVEMSDSKDENGATPKKRKPWERPGGTRMKRKKVPGAKNIKIRRYVKPKNAVMCLNELKPGLAYTAEQEGGIQNPFCVSVEVDGQKYRGYGSSKQLAKQAAAEAALISFVKPPSSVTEGEEDKTPWATLASFAIYKLFSDWREGRIGIQPLLGQALSALTKAQGTGDPTLANFSEALSAHLEEKGSSAGVGVVAAAAAAAATAAAGDASKGGGGGGGAAAAAAAAVAAGETRVPNPAKAVPENAANMHPVTVLHQMRPGLAYTTEKITRDNKPFVSISTEIDSEIFTGEGTNMKKAKIALAKDAIKRLYGVESSFEVPA